MFRKLLKVKTIGSIETGDLKPKISSFMPPGVNYAVYEYDEKEGWCILELVGSEHPILGTKQITPEKIQQVVNHSAVIQEIKSHPLSPPKLRELVVNRTKFDSVDKTRKLATKKGVSFSFKRIEKRHFRGEEVEQIVFDEG